MTTSLEVGGVVKALSWLKNEQLLVVGERLTVDARMAIKVDQYGITEGIALPEAVDQVLSVDVNDDGQAALGCRSSRGTGLLIILDPATGLITEQVDMKVGPITTVAWSSGGLIAVGHHDRAGRNVLTLWYSRRRTSIAQFISPSSHRELAAAWSTSGTLAWGWSETNRRGSQVCVISQWRPEFGQGALILERFDGRVDSLAWSPRGELAVGGWRAGPRRGICIWDPDRNPRTTPAVHGRAQHVAWSSDDQLAVACPDGELTTWRR
ncbi:WD40 repeat domain-containing protein [Kribbella sp. NPDC055071]